MADETPGRQVLNEEEIRALLRKKTMNLMERIDRNIRIGFIVLLLIIVAALFNDFHMASFFSGTVSPDNAIPTWIVVIDFTVNILIVALFITFVIHYYRTRRICTTSCTLRNALLKVISVLTLYQRLFTLALIIILLTSSTGFIAGYYTSVSQNQSAEGFLLPVLIIGLLLLAGLTTLLFLLLRWLFRKVYGNYLERLRETLRELE